MQIQKGAQSAENAAEMRIIMEAFNIEEYVFKELSFEEQKTAIDFICFLKENHWTVWSADIGSDWKNILWITRSKRRLGSMSITAVTAVPALEGDIKIYSEKNLMMFAAARFELIILNLKIYRF